VSLLSWWIFLAKNAYFAGLCTFNNVGGILLWHLSSWLVKLPNLNHQQNFHACSNCFCFVAGQLSL